MNKSPRNAVEWHSHIADDFSGKYSGKPAFVERMKIWKDLIETTFSKEDRVVDLGCGGGQFSVIAARSCHSVLSVDGSPEMLELCKQQANDAGVENVEFQGADLNTFDSSSLQPCDGILLSSVVEYLDDLNGFLEKVSGALTEGGKVIISMPNKCSLYRLTETLVFKLSGRPTYRAFVKNMMSAKAFSNLLAEYSLEVKERRFYAPAPLLSRLFRSIGLRQFSDNLFVVVALKTNRK